MTVAVGKLRLIDCKSAFLKSVMAGFILSCFIEKREGRYIEGRGREGWKEGRGDGAKISRVFLSYYSTIYEDGKSGHQLVYVYNLV